jgi:hypothetical protein
MLTNYDAKPQALTTFREASTLFASHWAKTPVQKRRLPPQAAEINHFATKVNTCAGGVVTQFAFCARIGVHGLGGRRRGLRLVELADYARLGKQLAQSGDGNFMQASW